MFDGGKDGKGGMKYDFAEFTRGAMGSLERMLNECADEK